MQHRRTKWVWIDGFSSGVWKWECFRTVEYQQVESSRWMEQQQKKRDGPVRCVCEGQRSLEHQKTVLFIIYMYLQTYLCYSNKLIDWYVYSIWQDLRTWQTDGRTDRLTPHDGIGRPCIASHGTNAEVKYRFMTSLIGVEMSDNCGLWAPWLIIAAVVYILSTYKFILIHRGPWEFQNKH